MTKLNSGIDTSRAHSARIYDYFIGGKDHFAVDRETAAQVLQRAAHAEPASRSVREALARAQFDSGQYADAAENFRVIVEASPTDDYAHFGLGLSLARSGDPAAAAEYLALAAAMRPDRKPYTDALRQVRATLKFRNQAP